MDIAKLNVRITIQKSEVTRDDIGNQIAEWKDFYSCFASSDTRGQVSEDLKAAMVVDHAMVTFSLRYTPKLKELTTQNYRILLHQDIYDIKGIDWMNYKKKVIKLITRRVER